MQFMRRYILPDARNATAEKTQAAVREIYGVIAAAESELLRKRLLSEVAPALGALQVTPDVFERDFAAFLSGGGRSAAGPSTQNSAQANSAGNRPDSTTPADDPSAPERDLLLLVLHFENIGPTLAANCPHDWINDRTLSGILINRFLAEFSEGQWPGRDHLDRLLESDAERSLVSSLLFEAPLIDDPGKVALEGLTRLRARALAPRLRELDLLLANASTDNTIDATALLKERSELQRRLRSPLALAPVA
jgi:DNA primase